MKIYILIFLFSAFFSCQSLQTSKSVIIQDNKNLSEPEIATQDPVKKLIKKSEKIGLIFSSGGSHLWASVNILKEFQKYKMPIVAVAGIEWGAVIAAIYSENLSPNEIEWQLSKFKSLSDWQNFLQVIFEKKNTSQLKIPFACSSKNLKNQKTYILSAGQISEFISYCVPNSEYIKSFNDSISDLNYQGLSQYLKSKGATKIVFFNFSQSKNNFADDIVDVEISEFKSNDFSLRKKILNLSFPKAYEQIKTIVEKYGY